MIDTSTNIILANVTVGTGPNTIAMTPNGSEGYVTNLGGAHSVSVINTSSYIVLATITVGGAQSALRLPRISNLPDLTLGRITEDPNPPRQAPL